MILKLKPSVNHKPASESEKSGHTSGEDICITDSYKESVVRIFFKWLQFNKEKQLRK